MMTKTAKRELYVDELDAVNGGKDNLVVCVRTRSSWPGGARGKSSDPTKCTLVNTL